MPVTAINLLREFTSSVIYNSGNPVQYILITIVREGGVSSCPIFLLNCLLTCLM